MKLGSRPPVLGAMATIALGLLSIASAFGPCARKNSLWPEQAFQEALPCSRESRWMNSCQDTMGFISASTNYNCTDCHVESKVEGDWSAYAQETPRKETISPNDSHGAGDQ